MPGHHYNLKTVKPFPLYECTEGFYTGVVSWIGFFLTPDESDELKYLKELYEENQKLDKELEEQKKENVFLKSSCILNKEN